MNKRNDFICIGAVHADYVLKLKQNYFKNRTNPVNHQEKLGGVAYNIAKILSFLNQNIELYSLNCNKDQKKEILKNGIKFKSFNKVVNQRYYTSVIDKNGKMIFGLANMDDYEKLISKKVVKIFKNKNIILDLNLSLKLITEIIIKNNGMNYICVCGTSAHKVYKIKHLLKKIDTIILNKQESLTLTNKKSIQSSMEYLIKQNNKLNIIITNGKNVVKSYINKIYYSSYPPTTNIKNENGAGDAFSAIFNYFYCNNINHLDSLNKGVCAGSLHASGYDNNKEKYLQKINKISRSIKYKIYNNYE